MSPIQSHKSRSSTGSLSRGNSTGAAIRRGEIKISDPIPIPREGIDGFGPQAGVSSPDFQSTTSLRNPKIQSERASAGRVETPPPPTPQPPKRSSPPTTMHKSFITDQKNPSNTSYHARVWSNSNPNPHDSMSSMPSKSSVKKKRKEGGLRSVMRKLFGSRRGEEQRRSSPMEHRSTQSTSVVSPATEPIPRTPSHARPPRSSSLPISEVTRQSALGSHSPFAPYFNLDTNQPPREDTGTPESTGLRRRATLPSIVLSPQQVREIAKSLGHGRSGSRKICTPPEGYDSGVGYATSNPNRRSRSMGRLRDRSTEHQMSPIQWRRRSDEIQFWRDSVSQNPVLGPSSGKEQDTITPEPQAAEESQRQYPRSQETEYKQSPFDFGPLMGTIQNTESATLEQRMNTLEVKVIDFEYAISKLQGHTMTSFQPTALIDSSIRRPQDERSAFTSSQSSAQGQYPAIGRPPESSTRATEPPPRVSPTFLSSPTRSLVVEEHSQRPTSDAYTVRPQTAIPRSPTSPSPTSPTEGQHSDQVSRSSALVTVDHFNSLISIIKLEEAARKKLELQVLQLQRQVQELQATRFPPISPGAYPTPSPESLGHPPTLLHRGHEPSVSVGSRRSGKTDPDPADSDTDEGFMDVYETPAEARDHKFGFNFNKRQQMAGMI